MSQVNTNSIYDASGGSNAVLYGVAAPANSMGFRNRIINGAMVIDQRNAGASVTPTDSQFLVDRWKARQTVASKFSAQQNAGSVTPPSGFTNYLGATSLSSYSVTGTDNFVLFQDIEGFNTSDLAWGTAGAVSVTLSFWVRSSLTGTFGGVIRNYNGTRDYGFTYTISASNTWEQKTITIPGDTSGTWATTNSGSIRLIFSLGVGPSLSGTAGSWGAQGIWGVTGATSVVGTSGATFYITGVQLEAGSVASPFERRDYGRELMMCQRYCFAQSTTQAGAPASYYNFGASAGSASTTAFGMIRFPVTMRSSPSLSITAGNTFFCDPGITNWTSVVIDQISPNNGALTFSGGSGMTAGYSGRLLANNTATASMIWSAEL